MKSAIIILNYNSEEDTIKYVNEIKQYNCLNRIIVVDNKSTNLNSYEKLKELENEKITVIKADKNGGYSYGNNFGIKYLENRKEEYDYIVISNPDVKVSEKAFEKCFETIEKDNRIALIAPRMLDKNNNPIRRNCWKIRTPGLDMVHSTRLLELILYPILRKGEYSLKDYEKEILEVEALSGAFFIIRSDVFKKVNYFDENVFLFYEEDILASKIKKLGLKEVCLNTVSFNHYESKSINKTHSYLKRIKQMYKSKMYYQKKYNKINIFQNLIFKILLVFRYLELLIEIPIRKLLKK